MKYRPTKGFAVDGAEEFKKRIDAGLIVLAERWPYGRKLVARNVCLLIEFNMTDHKGFVNGIWMYSPDKDGDGPEDIARRLVQMAVLRRAYLMAGWKAYVWNGEFHYVGKKAINKRLPLPTGAS